MKIYLAGLVPKGDREKSSYADWRKTYIEKLSKIIKADYIDPRDRGKGFFDESNVEAVFALDCAKIKSCDLLLVNGDNLGVGGAQEILIAKYFSKPVVTVLPKNTVHRRVDLDFNGTKVKDWIHPFLYCTCDLLLENIDELTKEKLGKVLKNEPKGLDLIDESIERFLNRN